MKVKDESFTISGQLRDPQYGNLEIQIELVPSPVSDRVDRMIRVRDMDTLEVSDWTEVRNSGTFMYKGEIYAVSEFINLN